MSSATMITKMVIGFVTKYIIIVFRIIGFQSLVKQYPYNYVDDINNTTKRQQLEQCLHMRNDIKNDDDDDDDDTEEEIIRHSSSTNVVNIDLWELRELALSKGGLLDGTYQCCLFVCLCVCVFVLFCLSFFFSCLLIVFAV